METFKPTLGTKPTLPQSKKFDANFKQTMNQNHIKLNETDGLLSEAEQSLKKKIFSLDKMEALVFSDPKLLAVYEQMSENGAEKYGYHYNETIQNIIFNDYVLNSPKYLQKYKMAIPKEKKRRDQSGINQLKKTGEETMKKKTDISKPKSQAGIDLKPAVTEGGEEITKVKFLVNETDPDNKDVFAYFPEETHHGNFKTAYSHVGQHSSAHPDYAAESRSATPEESAPLKAELEGLGYNLEVINDVQETTGAAGGGAGAFTPALGYQKKVQETTTSASSGQYSGPAAWGDGDLMKGGKSKAMRKPIWQGGTIIQESKSNYLVDPIGFEKYVERLNEQSNDNFIKNNSDAYSLGGMNNDNKNIIKNDIKTGQLDQPNLKSMEEGYNPAMYSTKEDLEHLRKTVKERTGKGLTKDHIPMLAGEALYVIAINMANRLLPIGWNDLPDTNSMWDYIDKNGDMSYDRLAEAVKEACNDRLSEEGMSLSEVAKSKSQQRLFGMAHAVQKGELSPSKVGGAVKKIAKTVKPDDVEDFASTKHEDLPEKIDEVNDFMKIKNEIGHSPQGADFREENGKKSLYFNGQDANAKKWAEDASKKYGIPAYDTNRKKDLPEKLNEYLSLYDTVEYLSDRSGEEPFMQNGVKWQFVNAKYPDGKTDIGVYRFGHDLVYDYKRWHEEMGINEVVVKEDIDNDTETENRPDTPDFDNDCVISSNGWKYSVSCGGMFEGNFDEMDDALKYVKNWKKKNNYYPNTWFVSDHGNESLIDDEGNIIKEDTQTMIADKQDSMSNKMTPTGGQSAGNVPTGMQNTGGGAMNESDMKLLEELNNELDAYSIHHNKLKKMSEDKKPSSLIMKDRLGDENKTNFKKDLQHSGTKEIIDVEKELQWADQQSTVKDPQKLGQDIEKKELDVTEGEALDNVGDSTNDKGDEIPKRNFTKDEQNEVDMYRLGQQSLVYDNENEAFNKRMQKDMGDKMYDIRNQQLAFKSKAPAYNKDSQPVADGIDKVQFDKEKSGWNDRNGIKESIVSGKYFDTLGKKRIVNFKLNEAHQLVHIEDVDNYFELNLTGLGNAYDNMAKINEDVANILSENKFYTDGKEVYTFKAPVQILNENEQKDKKPVINEQFEKMKHLTGYKPNTFVDTKGTKNNRGF